MFLYEALENRYISWGFFFLFSSWVLLFCYFILADSLTSCCCTCVHGCLGHPGASAASPPGVRGWEWLWTGDCKTRQQGKKLPHGWEEWAPSPSLLPPPAHQAAGTCERGAWGTACLDHSCPQRETSLITFISLSKNMNVFFLFYWSQKTSSKYSCQPSIRVWHEPSTNGQKMLGAIVWNECGEKAAAMN